VVYCSIQTPVCYQEKVRISTVISHSYNSSEAAERTGYLILITVFHFLL